MLGHAGTVSPSSIAAVAITTDGTTDGESIEDLFDEIARLTELNRNERDVDRERQLLHLRHRVGDRLRRENAPLPPLPEPDTRPLPEAEGLPDFGPEDVTPQRVRAAILRDGCMIVRGLVPRADAEHFAHQIERAYVEREHQQDGEPAADGYYEDFPFAAPYQSPIRRWIQSGGGLLAVDSPILSFELMEIYDAAGIPDLVAGYLGEPVISAEKTTLRKVLPTTPGAWHQDGAFMGDVRSLNLWVSLSDCGVDAPGLDIVPRRLDGLVETGTDDTWLSDQVSQAKAEEAAAPCEIVRPVFAPGDVVIFDDLCLHQTASDPSMTRARYAIECWFFAGAGFPGKYAPFALSRSASTR
jgi:hypothetical protein